MKTEIRKYQCPDCMGRIWVDCDGSDYPTFCPFCGNKQYDPEPEAEQPMRFIQSKITIFINE